MKRVLTLLFVFIITINCFAFSFVSAEEKYCYKYGDTELAKQLAETLGIVTYSEDTADDIVTRIDFAIYLARLLRIDEYAQVDKYYFDDVDTKHYGCAVINVLTQMGIITQNSARIFNPDIYITKAEICKMLFEALGYGEYARVKGGYPSGYLTLAAKSSIFDGVDITKDIFTTQDVTLILMNAASTAMYEPETFGETVRYAVKDDRTLLSVYQNIWADSGILNSAGGISLTASEASSNGRIRLGNTEYTTDGDYTDMLGEEVYVYYSKESDKECPRVVCVTPSDNQEIVEFDNDSYVGLEGSFIKYYLKDSTKIKNCKVNERTVYVKNGVQVLYDIENEIKTDYGFYKLIDNDDNGIYDVVMVKSIETFVVGSVDAEAGKIFDKSNSKTPVELEKYDEYTGRICDINGNPCSLSVIAEGDILSVMRDENFNYIKIVVCKKAEQITVESVYINAHVIIENADKSYVIADSFADYNAEMYREEGNIKQRFKIGSDYKLFFDAYGKVVYAKAIKGSDDYIFGYIIDVGIGGSALNSNIKFKLFCEDGNVNIFDARDKLLIDGVLYKSADKALAALPSNSNVVRFKIDDDNEIFDVDTTIYNINKESEHSLQCTRPYDRTAASLDFAEDFFGPTIYADSNTVVINISSSDTYDEDGYYIGSMSQFSANTSYNIEAYKVGKEVGAESVIVIRDSESAIDTRVTRSTGVIVDKISDTINADGEYVKLISGYSGGDAVSYKVSPDFDTAEDLSNKASPDMDITIDDIEPGDIIKIGTDHKNNIIKIQYYVDSGNLDSTSWKWVLGDFGSRQRQELAYCLRKNGSIIEWSYEPGGEIAGVYDLGSTKVVIFDSNDVREPFTIGTADDIVSYENAGEQCSRLYIETYTAKIRNVVVYK